MPVELRKRKEAPPAPAPPAKKKATAKGKKAGTEPTVIEKVQDAVIEKAEAVKKAVADKSNGASAAASGGAPKVGDTLDLVSFGGEIETHDGHKTTLAKLVEESKGGVVLFTYPKASTPGCTTQAELFRNSYAALTATGYSIYGLSSDSPKANTNFKTNKKLQYTLLCDPARTLISAIGLRKVDKGTTKTTRGVFVVDKAGKVLAAEPGGPAATVEVVKKLVDSKDAVPTKEEVEKKEQKEDKEAAQTADEVADSAAKVDAAAA